jgi:hypothetical protein
MIDLEVKNPGYLTIDFIFSIPLTANGPAIKVVFGAERLKAGELKLVMTEVIYRG